ncbi:AAA domain-containing protein [Actinomadura algeriensis]|uniref:Nucleoside-triphosphatase THEP1 n=1 Tax=Actinomadura algeriensis TaxID=1679523 RepID=A0ABR9JMF1_9ACTN|nr:AAA domain-containing protein [Actinomadura algeriensis]MBE1531739.1 nucleoside-triphosphatase THEP1 [Actinomadura algeriensis]
MTERQTGPYPIAHLHRAVELEIAAILHDDMTNAEKVSLRDGRLVRRSGSEREYLFSCKGWKDAFGSKDLLIRTSRSRGPWERAGATRSPDGKIRVTTEADLGTEPVNAQLVEDDTVGLVALTERLGQMGAGASAMNLTAAGWLVGQGKPKTGRCADTERFVPGYGKRQLNGRQRQAVERALDSELTFVWGPPGTGKTEVVASIVEGCYRQGLRVLFLAPTHVAVDQALLRMCDLLAREPQFESGLVQRAGDIAVASLAAKYGEQIDRGRIGDRLAGELDTEIGRITTGLAGVRGGIARHEEAARATTGRQELGGRLAAAGRSVLDAEAEVNAAAGQVARVQEQMAHIGIPSGMFARRKQARLDALDTELYRHRLVWEAGRQRLGDARADHQRCESELAAIDSALPGILARVQGLPPVARLREDADRLQKRLDDLQKQRQKIAETVRSRCRVLGTTVSKAVQTRRLLDEVDVVVIDEAGMVNLPSAWYTAGLARKRVVLAGDFRQLPAVTRGSSNRKASAQDIEHSRLWMDRDAFHAAGLVDPQGGARVDDSRMVALNEQYRMRRAICAVVNEVAYPDAPLLTGRREETRLPPSPLIDGPLVLIDTSGRVPDRGRRNAHTTNAVHEAAIHELIRGLQYDTVLPARKHTGLAEGERPADRLAVICPYKNQKKALNTSLAHRFGQTYDGVVDTVHRFQGSQRPLVVIDTVAGAGDRLGFFYGGVGLSSATCRLLNVALSRAQDHLVLVANIEVMHRGLSPTSEAARMLGYFEKHAQRLPVEELVPVRSAADLSGLAPEELARPAFFPADEVSRAVEWDIVHARRSIDIYCAFLAATPVRYWLRRLAPRIAAGMRVTVHTRQHDPGTRDADLVVTLRSAGCQVETRERMHEKVLIVDDTVLWHGSLNLLAHGGSTDLMMRITDATSCERVRRIVDRARMDRPARSWPTAPRRSTKTPPANGISPGDVVDGRLYLRVPFAEKDEAKSLVQAKWDPTHELWHVAASVPRTRLSRWLPDGT